jgi:hypothetical protein
MRSGARKIWSSIGHRLSPLNYAAKHGNCLGEGSGFVGAQHETTGITTLADPPVVLAFLLGSAEFRGQGLPPWKRPALRRCEDLGHNKQPFAAGPRIQLERGMRAVN